MGPNSKTLSQKNRTLGREDQKGYKVERGDSWGTAKELAHAPGSSPMACEQWEILLKG